jgi:hypothetical protein
MFRTQYPDAIDGGDGLCNRPRELPIPRACSRQPFRLDLARWRSNGNLAIGEIKPAHEGGFSAGIAISLAKYLAELAKIDPDLRVEPLTATQDPLNAATFFDSPRAGPKCPQQGLFVFGPIGGVYGYFCKPDKRDAQDCCKGQQEQEQEQEVPKTDEEDEKEPINATKWVAIALMALVAVLFGLLILAVLCDLGVVTLPVCGPLTIALAFLLAASTAALLLYLHSSKSDSPATA